MSDDLLFLSSIMKKIGFIGLGVMGKPMAKNLLKAGYALTVFDAVRSGATDVLDAGAVAAKSAKEVAAASEILITMLPNSPQVKEAILGPNGAAEGLRPGTVVVDMSSIAPLAGQEIAAELERRGIVLLDAPVSGGEPKAIAGTLAIMVGGPVETFEAVKGVLAAMGSSVTHVGAVGSGNIAKLANQMIVGLNLAAVSEAFVLATKAGVDPERVFQAIRGGLAGSTVLEAKMPLILAGNFKPGFRIGLHLKDLANAADTAQALDVPIELTQGVITLMQRLIAGGKAGEDHGGLIQDYEQRAAVEVRKRALPAQ